MGDENQNNGVPPVPPMPQAPVSQQAAAATPQPVPAPPPAPGAWQQPQQGWGQPQAQQPQQGWSQPQAQQPQQPQQGWAQPQAPQQGQQQWQQPGYQPQPRAGAAPTWDQLKASGSYQIPPEYPQTNFRPETFSIPAFFFSWIWYMVKGMWQKGLVLLGASIVIWYIPFGFALSIGIAIYSGMYGVRDYLRYYNSKQQFWF